MFTAFTAITPRGSVTNLSLSDPRPTAFCPSYPFSSYHHRYSSSRHRYRQHRRYLPHCRYQQSH